MGCEPDSHIDSLKEVEVEAMGQFIKFFFP